MAGDGLARADLLVLVDELGLGDVVEWLGPVTIGDVPAVLDRATVVVVPSRYEEPFGLVAVEAGLAGRPVVASRMGGLPEIVDDGRSGLLVPPDDAAALAAALLTVLGDRELAVSMGTAGRARAERDFALDRHVDAFETLFERLILETHLEQSVSVDPRREAFDRVGGRYDVRVLEPSPPAVNEAPWFADDPIARRPPYARPAAAQPREQCRSHVGRRHALGA